MNIIKIKHGLLFFCLAALILPIQCFGGGWGLESGRASEADAANLVIDQVAIRRAQARIAEAINEPTLAERQAGLVRNDDGTRSGQMVDRVDSVYQWWLKSVMEPAKAIVVNPAASCEEAQVSMQNLVSMMKNRNILGLDTEFNAMFDEIQTKGFQRCREEAFDECMVTGRFRQIVDTAISHQRSAMKTGTDAAEGVEEWADKALKQCAVYDLEFTSTTTTAQIFNLETVRRSKIRLEFKLENGIVEALLAGTKLSDVLKGETIGDVLLDSVKCAQPPLDVRCKPGEMLSQNFAKVLALDLKHREFFVDGAGMSQVRVVGEDNFAFEFGGGMYNVDAQVIVPRFGPVPIPMKAIGYGFYVAHNKDRLGEASGAGIGGSTVKVERNKRGVYPVLFDFIYADKGTESNASVSDSTEFKLVHKPKASDAPPVEKIRKPFKPRRGPGGNK
jgi:hypothetical protein